MPLRTVPPPLLFNMSSYSAPEANDMGCSTDPFSRLPNEMVLHIFSFLDPDQLLVCGQVCRRWRRLSFDWHLWQVKLFETRWCTIVCREPPPRDMPIPLPESPLHDPSSIHPRTVYRFLIQYIPKCDGGSGSSEAGVALQLSSVVPETPTSHLSAIARSIIYHVRGLFPFRNSNSANTSTTGASPNRPRFALFGPGLDHRWTSRLFWKMVDTRTRSFEPINVFTGHMGFESGITLRLFAQAQHAVMDGSTRCSGSTRKVSCDSSKPSNASSTNRFTSCLSAPTTPTTPTTRPIEAERGSTPLIHHSTEHPCQCHQHDDFTFDLSYLYSLPPHLKHVFNDQYTRLRVSRLFFHQSEVDPHQEQEGNEGDHDVAPERLIPHLEVTHEMREICRKLDGLIYAIDARESAEQLTFLYYELRAVLRAFPERTARRIPIVVLYIMPKEDIKFQKTPNAIATPSSQSSPVVLKSELVNRDSYSGAEYTEAWHDSILLVISALKLFELPNPWRLQKCSSNDIKTLIQSLMWLNLEYLRPVAVSNAEG